MHAGTGKLVASAICKKRLKKTGMPDARFFHLNSSDLEGRPTTNQSHPKVKALVSRRSTQWVEWPSIDWATQRKRANSVFCEMGSIKSVMKCYHLPLESKGS